MRLFVVLLVFLACQAYGQTGAFSYDRLPEAQKWADSVYAMLTIDERVGQVLMIRAHSDKGRDYEQMVAQQIMDYKVGGLCFFQGTPERQVVLTNDYQKLSARLPLMIAMDAEWGLNMRLKDACIGFPRQLMLGAIQDNKLLYDLGFEMARECKRLGVHVNFSPVADVNNNASNPVIHDRSFGEDPYNVAAKCYSIMLGMQDGGVMACAKHFPGHGDTDTDSHLDLPVILHDRVRLDSIELLPFRVLSQHGIGSMMVAHLNVPSLDNVYNRPSTLSEKTINGVLKYDLGYKGLIFTDAMEMKGVTKHFPPGEASAMALASGNDVVLMPDNVKAAFETIRNQVNNGTIPQARLESAVKKVLISKYLLGLSGLTGWPYIEPYNIRSEINSPSAYDLKRQLTQKAMTLVRDTAHIVPLQHIEGQTMAALALGTAKMPNFHPMLTRYGGYNLLSVGKNPTAKKCLDITDQLAPYKTIIISLHSVSRKSKDRFGLSQQEIDLIYSLTQKHKVILVNFGTPYALGFFDGIGTIVQAYDEELLTQELAAQGLYGVFQMEGKLPVSASIVSGRNTGTANTSYTDRLRYDTPESVGMSTDMLQRIDYIAQEAIDQRATPGCQVLVARHGAVIYQKAFGYTTYDKTTPITLDHVFDLASITKVMATTSSLMKLNDGNMIDMTKPLGQYLSSAIGTNKENVLLRDIMIHQAGLPAWIPFYKETMTRDQTGPCVDPRYYSRNTSDSFPWPVARELYLRADYPDTIRRKILMTDLNSDKSYKYSDLGMYLMADLVKEQSGMSLDAYAEKFIFDPLGMDHTGYNAWLWAPDSLRVPTEDDDYFRMQVVSGHVHDMGAAMMGGVSGHAGLFSNCSDMAIWAQMLLNKGTYAGQQYYDPTTVSVFTTRQGGSTRRGIGFDMKEIGKGKSANMSSKASQNTFGHTGFTGNCIWIDPDQDLIFIFLSNRTFPSMENNKLINGDYRPRMQSAVYDAINN
jgi:beta-N-acetylhexosaminidase